MTRPPTLYELMGRAAANAPSPPVVPSPPADQHAPLAPPAEPCPTCSNTIRWLDAYRRWHCIECEPYVSRRQARRKIFLVTDFSSDDQKEKKSWATMDLETSEEIKISDDQKSFDVSKLPFYSASASRPSASTQSPLILEAFSAKLQPPLDSGLTVEEWWKGELTERTREIDEVTAGKWKNVFATKTIPLSSADKTPAKRSPQPSLPADGTGSLIPF